MTYKIVDIFPHDMLTHPHEVCLSLYMPTHKLIFDHKKDVLVFKNLVKEAKASLEKGMDSEDIKPLLFLLKTMEHDLDLWNNAKDGLAIFATLDEMIIYRLESDVKPVAIVSKSFHIKPLVAYYQAVETFLVLALEAESFKLYKGNHHEMNPLELNDDVKTTLSEILGSEYTDSYQTHGTYGGASDGSTFHGHGGKSDEIDIDRKKFFRAVDHFVLEAISKKLKHPMLLVAHKEHHHDFREVSNNPYLLDDRIEGSYEAFKADDLKEKIKEINDQRFETLVDKEIEHYHNIMNDNLSSDQLIIVIKALLQSRVETLMIEKDKIISGKLDKEKLGIIKSDIDDPKTDDLLDDMIEHAYQTGTKVLVLDKEKMPTTSGVAATFRY